ncbi:MAG: GNAT family N-acetyltransferase [Chthoniobacterales bacterium]|nr:GNAT family N-acetyltransferase [Chthoniobacterales bacterium]
MMIRLATLNDLPKLLPLMEQLGYPCTIDVFKKYYDQFIRHPGHEIAVACDGTKILGWIAWSQSKPFVSHQTRFRIEGIVVDASARHQGIGKKLVAFLEEVAKPSAPLIIELCTGLRRAKDGTHEFYKNLGYKNEGVMAKLYLRKEIE